MRLALALYRFLTRLLPYAFRDEFGGAIEESFAARAAHRHGVSRLRFVLAGIADLIATIVAERLPMARRTTVRSRRETIPSIDRLRQDLVLAVRALRKRPAFSLAVIGTLALGVGANAAVFTLVDSVLLRPLPIADPARVVGLFTVRAGSIDPGGFGLDDGLPYSGFRKLQDQSRSLAGVAGFIDVSVGVEANGEARQLTAGAVSGNYFQLLGLRPLAGRVLASSDDRLGAPEHVAVLSDTLWSRAFARNPDAIGQTIRIGGTPFVVAGIAPRGFRGTNLASEPELWVPLTTITELRAGGLWNGPLGRRMLGDHPLAWVGTLGRLAGAATAGDVTAEVNRLVATHESVPGADRVTDPNLDRIVVRPVAESATLGDHTSLVRFLAILAAVVALTLVIGCLNVANLTWARTAERARELAVQSALGAGRGRLIWQLLVEYLVLASAGGAAALLVGMATVRLFAAFSLPGGVSVDAIHLGLTGRAVLLAAVLSGVSALVIGLGPALGASRPDSAVLLRSHGAGGRRPPRAWLVSGQVALTLILLVGASLFLRSLKEGLRTDLGFEPRALASVSVDLFRYGYTARTARPYYDDVLTRVAALPGVSGVALASHLPLAALGKLRFDAPDGPFTPDAPLLAGINSVTSEFFGVLGIPIVEGRTFSDRDVGGRPPVAILNQSAARQLFGGRAAIGREIRMFGAKALTVVGVVRDARYASVIESGVPMVYLSAWQDVPTGGVSVVVRTSQPRAMVAPLREVVQRVDPHVALYDARVVSEQVDAALAPQRFGTVLLSFFAFIGLTVAAVGIYSVVGCTLAERTSELGIRVALGASPRDVLRVVLRRTGAAIATGTVLGMAVAVPVSAGMARFLVGISPVDGWSFLAATSLIACAAVAAVAAPARRAIRTDPLLALRAD